MKPQIALLVLTFAFAGQLAKSQSNFIDFEKLPDGSLPTEGMAISNQFAASHGVSFAFTNGTFPLITMRRGTNVIAFLGPSGDNTFRKNQGNGDFFLTDPDGEIGLAPPPLVITYSQVVSNASGAIYDIDSSPPAGGNEAWRLEARGTNDDLIASTRLTVATKNSGDGLATPWSFRNVPGIQKILVIYDGPKTNKIGLAFDNFSPSFPQRPAGLQLSLSNHLAQIEIAGSFDERYRVEWSTNLAAGGWQILTNVHLANAPVTLLQDSSSGGFPQRFYRAKND